MVNTFSPGSFTKNFGWRADPNRLHRCIRAGFSRRAEPTTRERWRADCGLNDSDIDLIPMDFFLYSRVVGDEDYVLVDRLVEKAVDGPHDASFFKLSLFSFHLANSGTWKKSIWPDGNVAGWANLLIRDVAWRQGGWRRDAFEKSFLLSFLSEHVTATPRSLRKMLNNYRFMISVFGVLNASKDQAIDLNVDEWGRDAIQLFWDRSIFDGRVPERDDLRAYEREVTKAEIHKLLGCDEAVSKLLVLDAYRAYGDRAKMRFDQLRKLGLARSARVA